MLTDAVCGVWQDVSFPAIEPMRNVPSPQWNVTCSVFGLQGGGLYIAGTATLTNTNVYSNQAEWVRSLSALA